MRNRKGTQGRAHLLWALLLVIALSTLGLAQHAAKSNGNGKGADTDEAIGTAGQQVAIDPASGKLRQPTREEIQTLTESLRKNLAQPTNLPIVYHADGSLSIILDEQFENAALAKINSDGTVSEACVNSVGDAEKFLKSDRSNKAQKEATPAPVLEEK